MMKAEIEVFYYKSIIPTAWHFVIPFDPERELFQQLEEGHEFDHKTMRLTRFKIVSDEEDLGHGKSG